MGNPLNFGRVSALSVADVTPGWHALDESRRPQSTGGSRCPGARRVPSTSTVEMPRMTPRGFSTVIS
jgi:hypothetical protein